MHFSFWSSHATKQFWILKELRTMNLCSKFKLNLLNTFSVTWVWKFKIIKGCIRLINVENFANNRFSHALLNSGVIFYQRGGGRNFYCSGVWRCDMAVPGNRVWAVENGWLPRKKERIIAVDGGNRCQNWGYANLLNITVQDWKTFSLAIIWWEKDEYFSSHSAGLVYTVEIVW